MYQAGLCVVVANALGTTTIGTKATTATDIVETTSTTSTVKTTKTSKTTKIVEATHATWTHFILSTSSASNICNITAKSRPMLSIVRAIDMTTTHTATFDDTTDICETAKTTQYWHVQYQGQ